MTSSATSTTTPAITATTTRATTERAPRSRPDPQAGPGAAWLLTALLALTLGAFGGRHLATAILFSAGSVLYALSVRGRARMQDVALLPIPVILGVLILQYVPLPVALRDLVSPHAREAAEALALAPSSAAWWGTLSLNPFSTLWATAVIGGALALFFAAVCQFGTGGLRQTVRSVAALGFGVSLLAIAQAATAGRRIYWTFPTEFEGPLPFGPFVNRNHFATWAIMAVPLTFGYIAAHVLARRTSDASAHARTRATRALDARTAWMGAAVAFMLIALLLSLSRSGALALGASTIATLWLARHSIGARQRRSAAMAIGALALFAALWSDLPKIGERLAGADVGLANRLTIWRETLPIVRDFWVAGTGAGTYQAAMLVYQRAERTVYFNQAHNHYLQAAAEGGLLLCGALLFGAAALVRAARRRLHEDRTHLRWIRIGAAAGLGAVALQSVWETGLVMPANAALAAVLAAVLVHRRPAAGGGA